MSEASRQQKITRLRGFQDIVGTEARTLALIEDRARAVAELYNFKEIRLPLLERIDLYERSTGETSDIVQKQMYVVQRHDESQSEGAMVLRPEGTPGVVRAYIEQGLDKRDPEQRFFYSGPMFRYERPQKGRFRQFHQFGVEVFGRPDAACDAELIIMIDDLRKQLGLSFETQMNSLGDANCRPKFREALLEFGRSHFNELCEDCRQRLERNPLRILDCKIDVRLADSAPRSADYLCDECRKHFDAVVELVSKAEVPYKVNPRLVRGLDYYTRTTFEVVSSALGAQNTTIAGGRYDGLVEALGGAKVPGTGFAIGAERLAMVLEANLSSAAFRPDLLIKSSFGTVVVEVKSVDSTKGSAQEALVKAWRQVERYARRLGGRAAIVALGESALVTAFAVARRLRQENIRVEVLPPGRRLGALLARADKIGASHAAIIGEEEVMRQIVQLRDLKAGTQRQVSQETLAAELLAAVPD